MEPKAIALQTYAVSLHFDKAGSAALSALMAGIAQASGNRYMQENGIPPHCTLGMFHAARADEERIKAAVTAALTTALQDDCPSVGPPVAAAGGLLAPAGGLRFSRADTFRKKTLFLCPDAESSAYLAALNQALHEGLLPLFAPACNRRYKPAAFFPHCALASGLSAQEMKKALSAVQKAPFPISAGAGSIILAVRRPYEVVWEASFSTFPEPGNLSPTE